MNKSEFEDKLNSALSTSEINVKLLSNWFNKILEVLNTVAEQHSSIEHPGRKGQSREDILTEQLEPMLPKSLQITKGFAVDRNLTVSKEQDLLVLSRDSGMSLIPGQPYYPIHSCLASIEVKSNLTLAEVRRAILNCISVKKLLTDHFPKTIEDEHIGRYCYAIFAYNCGKHLEGLAGDFNDALESVPHHLRPNLVYVLGRGMLIPSETPNISLGIDQMFTDAVFRPVPEMGAPPSIPATEAYAFIWFLTNIVDHCLKERKVRPQFVFRLYWETTLSLQAAVNRMAMEGGGLPKE